MKAAAIGARGGRGAQSAYLCNTSDLALLQADEFFRLKSTHRLWTQCPTQGWTEALRSALQPAAADGSSSSPRPSRLVFFDVGCNKGYESARLLDVFVPGSGLDPPSLYALYKKRQAAARPGEPRFETLCGSCDNCKEKSEATGVSSRRAATMKSQHVEIHCFEPGGANFRLLQAAHSHFFPNDTSSRMGGSSSAEVASGGGSSNSSNLLGFSRSSLSSQTVVGMAIAEVGVYDGTGVILSRRSAAGTATRFNSQPQSTENVSAPPPPSSSSSTISARWVLHNAAAGDVDGSVKFPADCRTTRCRIGKRDIDSGSSGLVDVRALTIDR